MSCGENRRTSGFWQPYNGSIVHMGVKNADGSAWDLPGIRKDIRMKIGKQPGDGVHVTIRERA